MVKWVGGCLVLVVLLFAPWGADAFKNEPSRLRGIPWGADLSSCPDMTVVDDVDDTKYCRRDSDDLEIEKAQVSRIVYSFYKNRFDCLMIFFASAKNSQILKDFLVSRYGQPSSFNAGTNEYYWFGKSVGIMFSYIQAVDRGEITYFYLPLKTEREQAEKSRKAHTASKE